MYHSLCLTASLSLFSFAYAQNTLTLSPAAKATGNVSAPLDASFAGFGIEPSNLFSFTGGDDTNTFSVQLLQNLADYSGAPPHIRVGGNTGDYMIYDSSMTQAQLNKNTKSVGQGNIPSDSLIFGPTYFEAIERFPAGTPITFGLNLAYEQSDYIDNIVKEAKAVVGGLKKTKLYSFEIGNEPDLYLQNTFRNGTWTGQVYTDQFLERAEAVYQQVLKPAGLAAQFFEAPATASTIGTTFEMTQLLTAGITKQKDGTDYIKHWNQHDYFYFIGVSNVPLTLDDLMNFANTESQFAYWKKQVQTSLDNQYSYMLREMSSVGPIGMHLVSDTFGAALWTLNFFLYTASLNVSSVEMHMTDNSNASAWQPIEMYGNKPFVRPQYYAHAAIAQIVGNGNGTTQISSIGITNPPSGYDTRIRAYSAYANGNLQAVVVINSKQVNATATSKGSITVTLNLGSDYSNKDLFLSYLTADGADSLSGTTWNGISFSDSDGKANTVNSTITSVKTSSTGSVDITVRDSQAIVANVGSLLGNNAVLTVNGTTVKPSHKSGAGSQQTGADTATKIGIATTTLAVATSLSGGASGAEDTGKAKSSADVNKIQKKGSNFWMVVVCITAVAIGFICLA